MMSSAERMAMNQLPRHANLGAEEKV